MCYFVALVLALALGVMGCSERSGTGGNGGTAGVGGSAGDGGQGGAGGAPPKCIPTDRRCQNAFIDPIVEDPACMLEAPPELPDACSGSESNVNPESCPLTGTTSLHVVQALEMWGDCNGGFDLDSCDGDTCIRGELAPGEGRDGVDNGLTGLASSFAAVGPGPSPFYWNQMFYDSLCARGIDWQFRVDTNSDERCVTVTPIYDGIEAGSIPMNLSETGCVSGVLGTLPMSFEGAQFELSNGTVRGTLDPALGLNFLLGATVKREDAAIAFEAVIFGGGVIASRVLDINWSLESDSESACDALSASFLVGGTLVQTSP